MNSTYLIFAVKPLNIIWPYFIKNNSLQLEYEMSSIASQVRTVIPGGIVWEDCGMFRRRSLSGWRESLGKSPWSFIDWPYSLFPSASWGCVQCEQPASYHQTIHPSKLWWCILLQLWSKGNLFTFRLLLTGYFFKNIFYCYHYYYCGGVGHMWKSEDNIWKSFPSYQLFQGSSSSP